MLLLGLAVAAVTLFVSWKFGVVFFLLPLFFFWSWGGGDKGPGGGGGRKRPGGDGPAGRPPAGPGLDGDGI